MCTFFSPLLNSPYFPSYESSWIKSEHYKTIRSEASGNAAGIRHSPPTAAARDEEGEESVSGWEGWGGYGTATKEGALQKRKYDSQVQHKDVSFLKNSCLPLLKKPSAFNVDQRALMLMLLIPLPGGFAHKASWDHRLIIKVIRSAFCSFTFPLPWFRKTREKLQIWPGVEGGVRIFRFACLFHMLAMLAPSDPRSACTGLRSRLPLITNKLLQCANECQCVRWTRWRSGVEDNEVSGQSWSKEGVGKFFSFFFLSSAFLIPERRLSMTQALCPPL